MWQCFVCILLVCLLAQAHHDRYNTTVAWLPCRYDYEQAQWAAGAYLRACHAANITTWIVGAGRLATLHPNSYLPATLEFAVQTHSLPFQTTSQYIRIHRNIPKPPCLEPCSLGFVRNMLREPLRRKLQPRVEMVHIPRRNVLDLFRIPWRATDPYPALVYDDGEITGTHNNDMS